MSKYSMSSTTTLRGKELSLEKVLNSKFWTFQLSNLVESLLESLELYRDHDEDKFYLFRKVKLSKSGKIENQAVVDKHCLVSKFSHCNIAKFYGYEFIQPEVENPLGCDSQYL